MTKAATCPHCGSTYECHFPAESPWSVHTTTDNNALPRTLEVLETEIQRLHTLAATDVQVKADLLAYKETASEQIAGLTKMNCELQRRIDEMKPLLKALRPALDTLETCEAPECANEGDVGFWIERRDHAIRALEAAIAKEDPRRRRKWHP